MWTNPIIIETIIIDALISIKIPAYTTIILGSAGVNSLSISGLVKNILRFLTSFGFIQSKSFRRFIIKHIVLVSLLDGALHTLSILLLYMDVIGTPVYVIIQPILGCTVDVMIISIWHGLPTLLFNKTERKKYDQIFPTSSQLGTIIGSILAMVISVDVAKLVVLITAVAWIDNIFLLWFVYRRKVDLRELIDL